MNPPTTQDQPTLPRNEKREAIPALTGYDYQVWVAISQWFDLSDNSVLFLEGAEDVDNVTEHNAETIQIRHTQSKISLNTAYAREAIKNFWSLTEREQHGRDIKYLYLTTSEVATESNANFDGLSGIKFWETAKHNPSHASRLGKYLAESIAEPSSLFNFLVFGDAEKLQMRLFSKFTWLTNQPNIDVVSEIVLEKIQVALKDLYDHDYPKASLEQIRGQLHAYCWEQLRKPNLEDRTLSKASLVSQLHKSATITVALPIHASASLIGMTSHLNLQGSALTIGLLVETIPLLPTPTLLRKDIATLIRTKLSLYTPVLLTGTVHQGKSTIASIVANAVDRNAAWVDLTDRPAGQIREIFNFFSLHVESAEFPSLIVFDDLNTNISQQAVYSRALQKLIFKSSNHGISILLTARGNSEAVDAKFSALNVELVEIVSMSASEIAAEAVELGCPGALAVHWGAIVAMQTSGHAKLVQVRLNELRVKGWRAPVSEDFAGTSQAVQTERHLARALLSDSLNANGYETEFVYTAAEFAFSPSRSVLLNLGDLIPGLASPGDLITRLEGKWLEAATGGRLRVTPLIKAQIGQNWSEEKFKIAHTRLFDAVSKQNGLTPIEGAGLVYHGFISGDGERLAQATINALAVNNYELKSHIFRNLAWLPNIGLQSGKRIFPAQEQTSLFLRNLQFKVAAHEDSADLAKILTLWWGELELCAKELHGPMSQLLHISVLTLQPHIPMKLVVKSAKNISNDEDSFGADIKSGFNKFEDGLGEIPQTSSPFQIFLAVKQNIASDLDSFVDLLTWIEEEDQIYLMQFDEIINWPISQQCGAFVHSAWVNYSKRNIVWQDLIKIFYKAWEISKNRRLRNFGIEIAKALSLIECEYKSNLFSALEILDRATKDFGASAILEEQRANCYFHNRQYENTIIVWRNIELMFPKKVIDPFAYRRAGIAATEINRWEQAASYFISGALCLPAATPLPTRSALFAEAALAYSKAGLLDKAVALMLQCEEELPKAASIEGDARWEAILRTLTAASTQIRGDSPSTPTGQSFTLKSGFSSNPELSMSQTDKLQKFRLSIFKLEANTSYLYAHPDNRESISKIEDLFPAGKQVAFLATTNLLAFQLRKGIHHSYIRYVEKFVEVSEQMRVESPFSSYKYTNESLLIGHYILPILLEKASIQDLINYCESPELGVDATASRITLNILKNQIEKGPKFAQSVLVDSDAPIVARVGAALVISQGGNIRADALTASQALLAAVAMRAIVAMKSTDIEYQVAAKFIESWKPVLRSSSQLTNPEWTLPALNEVFREVRRKRAGLKQLLKCASAASGVNIEAMISNFPDNG